MEFNSHAGGTGEDDRVPCGTHGGRSCNISLSPLYQWNLIPFDMSQLREPEHEIVSLTGSDENVGEQVREAVTRLASGRVGKKILLRFQDD
jgi:hypothetical protein